MAELMIVGAALSAVSAVGSIKAGKAAQRAYQMQAKQAELEGRQKALEYKQEGVKVLRDVRKNLAAVTARAGAGNIDPFSGTPQGIATLSMEAGFGDQLLLRQNALLAEKGGIMQAGQYEMAGQQARLQGYVNAVGQLGQAAMMGSQIGKPTPTTTPVS